MPTRHPTTRRFSREATRSAGAIVEHLDVLWEHARGSTAAALAPVSASQLRLMYLVDRDEGVRMRTLCTRLATAAPSVTRMCDRLQATGFLERLPCPGNGREVTVRLTPEGRGHLQSIREQRETTLHEVINALPQSERRALAKGLAGLHARLTAEAEEESRPGFIPAA
ncbi:MarR family transcriptional regulator [Streptomyces sp. NPDC046925]|uniref:MarR family winged helix-turn-helix transcriptional regulator n=1 Tax=Streptomyces sp. NPDC046925 TaxID=3155375 RepID=UPI0033C04088